MPNNSECLDEETFGERLAALEKEVAEVKSQQSAAREDCQKTVTLWICWLGIAILGAIAIASSR